MTSPRRSARITGPHGYHGAVRPCAPHRYSAPRGSAAWGSPFHGRPQAPTAPLAARGRGATGSHVPHRSPDQARAAFMPGTAWSVDGYPPGSSRGTWSASVSMPSTPFDTSSTVRFRSPSWPTPDALTARLSPQRSAPRLLTGAPCGGLQPPPAGRLRRTTDRRSAPPSPMQHRVSSFDPLHRHSLCVRGHTPDLWL